MALFSTHNYQLQHEDFEELKARVLNEFGFPTVNVEVSDSQIINIIKRAGDLLSTWSPRIVEERRYVFPNVSDYEFNYNRVNSVISVIPSGNYLIAQGIPIEIIAKVPLGLMATSTPQFIDQFIDKFQRYENAKRMLGLYITGQVIRPNKVRILPTPTHDSMFLFVLATDHVDDLTSLDDWELNWLVDFTKAKVAQILGRTRGKYTGVTLPIGDLSNDASDLLAMGKESEDMLIDMLKKRRRFPEAILTIG